MYLSFIFFLETMAIGLAAGGLGSMVGIGGGVLLVPLLTLGLNVPIHQAIGASLVAVIATSSTSVSTYLAERLTNIRLAMTLEVASVAGAILGGITASLLNRNVLSGIFTVVLVFTIISMSKRKKETPAAEMEEGEALNSLGGEYFDQYLNRQVKYTVSNVPLGLGISFLAGNISGLLGIGGGVIKVPILVLAMGVPMRVAAATSNLMVGITAMASAYIYYNRGFIDPLIAVPVIIGVFLGAGAGSRLALRVNSALLVRILVVILAILAVNMVLYAFGIELV